MNAQPLISVLMPAYNSEKYISEAIDSILNQTFSDFELCIINDGSSDATGRIIDSYEDPRIIKTHLTKNQGLVAVRNALIKQARGKYIAYLDNDDVAFPDRLEKQFAFLEAGKADLCSGAHQTYNEETGQRRNSKQAYSDSDIRALITVYCPLCNPAVMGKAEIFKKFQYQSGNDHAEDYSLWQALALAGYRFANLKDQLITYRIHPKQISRVQNASAMKIFDRCRADYIAQLGIDPLLSPRKMPILERLRLAPKFLVQLNKKIPNISLSANYQIYSRYQFRGNGIYTPFTRLERFLVACYATLVGYTA
ncbi:glycosyltransferase family 2 protein [Polynucleobacter brandtiae]|uniref:Glycosyltransferase involved in cell wall biosynthesis n=1 Tax=Polynucleobacter brandtiae TaxID=1938816 RepID=A0A2M8VR43_9BURK|nr:glycosyltransferase family 2 protein [Polynucleobacter brandtiae]PJI79939.1 glycosyltransferase involved in cell wall biosynthesis [Polynucleobacter brandtiae]